MVPLLYIIMRFVSAVLCRMTMFSKKKDPQTPKKGSGKEKGDKEQTQSPSSSPVPPVKEQMEVAPKPELKSPPPEEKNAESEGKCKQCLVTLNGAGMKLWSFH